MLIGPQAGDLVSEGTVEPRRKPMGLRINTNVTSLAAQRTLGKNNMEQALSLIHI